MAHRIALLALIAFVVLTPSSIARAVQVVPDACIGNLGLWDNAATVRKLWGKPVSKHPEPPEVWWDYPRGESVLLHPWRGSRKPRDMIVRVIRTQDPNVVLPSGIGFGTPAEVARARYPQCKQGLLICDVGKRIDRETAIWFSNRRVSRLSISLRSRSGHWSTVDGPRERVDRRCRGG